MTKAERAPVVYLNLLLAANYVLACLEELEGTKGYRHTVKLTANKFKKELEKLTDEDMSVLWGTEDSTMYAVMDEQENLLKELAKMGPENYAVLNEMITRYKQNPVAFQAWAEVKIIAGV